MNRRTQHRIRRFLDGAIVAGTLAGPLAAERLSEDFSHPPSQGGWQQFGDTALFRWDPTGQYLGFTWDSSRPNSGVAHRLPRTITQDDDASFAFDLTLDSHAVGVDPNQPGTFQIAVGFVKLAAVRSPQYVRGALPGPHDTLEWAWFGGDSFISPSISPAVIPSDGRLPWGYADSFVELQVGVPYRFEVAYTAADRTVRLRMRVDGLPGPALENVVLPAGFTGFSVDAFAVVSYSGQGQNPLYAGSVLASGRIDNVLLTVSPPPITAMRLNGEAVAFRGLGGWTYELEASTDLSTWGVVATLRLEADGPGELSDLRDAVFQRQFYRIRARRL